MANMAHVLDRKCEGMDFAELVNQPVDALQGLSAGDAEALQKAFNIRTIGDLGRNKYFQWAAAIVAMSGSK